MAHFTGWSPELEAALAEPFPREFVQQKRKGGSSIDFVAWHFYARRLNDLVGGGWSMGEPILKEVGGKLVVALPLTILGTTRVNFGSEEEEKDDFGDAATNSWAQAFKRTCALFGLGLGMYDKSGAAAAQQRRQNDERHAAMVAWIKETATRCEPEVEFTINGHTRPVREYVKAEWDTIKSDLSAARLVVQAMEKDLGQQFRAS